MSLHPKALALAMGILYGGCLAAFAVLSMLFDIGTPMIDLMATFYRGFSPSVPGMIVGFLWGAVEGWIFGWLLASLYNHFVTRR